jgi:3-isopropylmalate dehydrogenase
MKIAVLPGDGIGPEIVAEAVKVLKALGPKFELETAPVGGAAYDVAGHPLPPATLELAKKADAILFGAVGDWKYDALARELRPEQAILGLRKHLELFANFRPAICYDELTSASSLKPEIVSGLDILIIRELNGDIYFGQPRGIRTSELPLFKGAREGFDMMHYSEEVFRRIVSDFTELTKKLHNPVRFTAIPLSAAESASEEPSVKTVTAVPKLLADATS